MNDNVVEAAAKARYEHLAGRYPEWEPWEDQAPETRAAHVWAMDAAIRAADRARARDVKAAVATVGYWAWRCGMGRGQERDDRRDRLKAAYRDLFTLLGIDDGENVTEGE